MPPAVAAVPLPAAPEAAGELSEDSDPGQRIAGAGQKRKGLTSRAEKRLKGSKRVPEHEAPIPLNFEAVGEPPTGYQKYTLPAGTRAYSRRTFTYSDEHKSGAVIQDRPAPPTLWPDLLIMVTAKKVLTEVNPDDEDNTTLLAPEKLARRLEARIVRVTFDHFKLDTLKNAPSPKKVKEANDKIKLVFRKDGTWNNKQIMSWAWPEIPITGDAAIYYTGKGTVTSHKRSSMRLLSIVLLSTENREAAFSELFGQGQKNRFSTLTGDVRAAADLLSTVVREGVLIKDGHGGLKARDNLASLFEEFEVRSLPSAVLCRSLSSVSPDHRANAERMRRTAPVRTTRKATLSPSESSRSSWSSTRKKSARPSRCAEHVLPLVRVCLLTGCFTL